MNIQQIVQKLNEEINGNNRKERIETYEELLSENAKELSKNEDFFKFPLNHIFSVISNINFNEIDEKDKTVETIQNIIKNLIQKHFDEKETILILQKLNFPTISFSYEELFSILELITNCPILVTFCDLYKEINLLPEKDLEYQIQQKEIEIDKHQQKIEALQQTINSLQQPGDYEPDILKACMEGKLSSVQYLIEKAKESKIKQIRKKNIKYDFYVGDTPIHIAAKYGYLPIVQYLIEKQEVDIEIQGNCYTHPLHYACLFGYLPIVEYLLSKGANIEAKDIRDQTPLHYACESGDLPTVEYLVSKGANIEAISLKSQTPLHYACENGSLEIVEFLLSKGANIEAKDYQNQTPLHIASSNCENDIIQFLVSKGANKNAKDKNGKTPYDLADKYDKIRKILK